MWTVGEQVGIVSVKQREIDGVGLSTGRGYSLTVMAETETAGLSTLDSVCACVHICAALYMCSSIWRYIVFFLKQKKI